ncbi:uncharacterized protein BDV14DRAFT_194052 [Aspergillus stella-maris]|uniref:uncharacterized protein n=1 Tax=Aspergillus stella-maris TaxID=1810926 RepID=UPI003CCDA554
MESAAQAILVTLLLGLGFLKVRSGGWWKSVSLPVIPPGNTREGSPEKDTDRTSTLQSSPLPPSTCPPSTPSAPQQAILPSKKPTDYTVGWICAIVTEYAAAQVFLDEEHEAPDFVTPGDTNDYTLGRIGNHNVVIAVLPDGEYGTASAAMVATNMQNSFPNVRIGLLVGIGGGVPSERHDIRLGDVVVSAPRGGKGGVFQYDFGKTMQGRSFQHTRYLNQPPIVLRTALAGLRAKYEIKGHQIESTINSILHQNTRLRQKYGRPPGNADTLFRAEVTHNPKGCADFCASNPLNIIQRRVRTTNEQNPAIHYGLIASANQVMKDALVRDQLAAENDILCFEMEAAGLMNQFPCLVIRGICDYSDSHKNKEWQGFAAMTAAAYASDMLRRIPPNLVEAEKKISEILLGIHDIAKEDRDLSEQIRDNAKAQLEAQNKFAKERLSDKEQKCHQLFRLTSGSEGGDTYEWYKNRVEDRVENTCIWFLQHENFQEWLQNESGPLLVSADPGCGKSVLARYLIDNYLPRSATICYFFFKDKVQDKVQQALCALLHQLFSQKPYLIKHAMEEYSKDGESLINSTESLWKVLRNAVSDPQSGKIIIVLDALDECSELDFPDLTRNVESHFHGDQLSQGKLKYLLTCRPYESIVSEFGSLLRTFPNIRIPGEEESETISYEVNHVITHRVNQLSQKKNLSSKVQRQLEEGLRQTPHRTYLWVHLVFNYLVEENFKKTPKGVESTLKVLPRSVNAAYEQILNRSKEYLVVRKALSIILAASRPLTLAEMNIAMSVDATSQCINDLDLEDEEDFKLRFRTLCGLFILIYQGRLYFLHQTAREFLLGDLRSSTTAPLHTRWYRSIAITQAHEVLATICVHYLNMFNSDTTISTDAEQDDSIFTSSHDFLEYAAKVWTTHCREAGSIADAAVLQSTLKICDPDSSSYAAWFRIFWETTGLEPTKHFTDLMLASYCGHSATAKLLLENGAEIDAKDVYYGQTPLSWAAENGHAAVIKLLLETGNVDVDSKDSQAGRTPLSWAAENGHVAVVKLLLESGKVDVDSKDSQYENGHEAIVKLLLKTGKVDVDSKDSQYGQTPLSWAAEKGHEATVKLLLETGKVDVNSKDSQSGGTPLSWAARYGHEAVAKLLLETKNMDVDSQDSQAGRTPLSWAAGYGHAAFVRLLLETGKVDVNSRDFHAGRTPLLWTARYGHEAVVKLLLETGKVDVDSKDSQSGGTPLSWAARYGHEAVAKLLLETKNVDVDSQDSQAGQTPLSWAARYGHKAVVKLLESEKMEVDSKDFGY